MTTSDDGRRSIIAVVDDDQRILEALEILLESAGYDARLFPSATALLRSGGGQEIDCLISDIDLPTIDGFELMRRAYAARAKLPVILVTGHADMLKRGASTSGCHYRLFTKPFDGQELLRAVSDAVRDSQRPIPGSC